MGLNQLPLTIFVLLGLVVVTVVGLATGSWAVFGIVLALHVLATVIVVTAAVCTARHGTEGDADSRALERLAAEAERDDPQHHDELEAPKHRRPRSRRCA